MFVVVIEVGNMVCIVGDFKCEAFRRHFVQER